MDDKDMVILLDGNGFIAGVQTVVMKDLASDDVYNFTNSPYYVPGYWNGEEAYFVTAYFVNTSIICNGGRTEEEFQGCNSIDISGCGCKSGTLGNEFRHVSKLQT